MMFQRSGVGAIPTYDTSVLANTNGQALNPQGSADCQWCQDNAFLGMFLPSCWQTKSMFGGSCSQPSVPQQYVINSAPAAPPDQATINAQTPDETVNQILSNTQANAVQAATAQAGIEASTLPAPSGLIPGLSVQDVLFLALASIGLILLLKK